MVTAQFFRSDELPPDRLIASGNVIPFVEGKWLLIRFGDGRWTVPGGTRNPKEPLETALRRELLEEAGAVFETAWLLGYWRCLSRKSKPYRFHVPHPLFYRVVFVAEAHLVGDPLGGTDAEPILEVGVVPLFEAFRRLVASGRRDVAELYLLAASLRKSFP